MVPTTVCAHAHFETMSISMIEFVPEASEDDISMNSCFASWSVRLQTQRHCDKADKVFSDVVDCCGNGLSSVESILEGTKTIVDEDGEDKKQEEIIFGLFRI